MMTVLLGQATAHYFIERGLILEKGHGAGLKHEVWRKSPPVAANLWRHRDSCCHVAGRNVLIDIRYFDECKASRRGHVYCRCDFGKPWLNKAPPVPSTTTAIFRPVRFCSL
jgi:hypothetical protein